MLGIIFRLLMIPIDGHLPTGSNQNAGGVLKAPITRGLNSQNSSKSDSNLSFFEFVLPIKNRTFVGFGKLFK
jgi:hypothetical protein